MDKRRVLDADIEAVWEALRGFTEGAGIAEIRAHLNPVPEPRTLQRRLKALEEEGRVRQTGVKKGTRYFPVMTAAATAAPEVTVPLSDAALQVRKVLAAAEAERPAVGYRFDFLHGYRPNQDYYLTSTERALLHQQGATPAAQLPAGTYARQIVQRLLIDLSYNSSRLEGNTYSLLDTQRLINEGRADTGKTAEEAQMILNHKEAIEFLVVPGEEIGINRYTVTNIHALLSDNLLPDPAASGRLRQHPVGIARSVYTPLAVPQQIEECFELLLEKARAIADPFEQAFFLMVQLPYLQPFDDVNKRVSRLAANIPLNARNLVPLAFVDVPQELYIQGLLGVYEQNKVALLKDVFLWAYERSAARYAALRQSLGEPDPFRMRYRAAIRQVVTAIVAGGLQGNAAADQVSRAAAEVNGGDRQRFSEVVLTELKSLHEGNMARYGIRPSQYSAWKKGADPA
ncbi:MAG: Fic family protein [Chitinophagaceae bacterium]|nr:MAG: Fic family protein [Chitinophagaceae bacterium]